MFRSWYLVLAALALGCTRLHLVAPLLPAPHEGAEWYAFRGWTLGLTPTQARARDEALSEAEPPDDLEDPWLRREGRDLWLVRCAGCHGADGTPTATAGDPLPRRWGTFGAKMGFLFGGDRMRAGVFRRIAEGKPPRMPAWHGTLAREQIWALVHHLEGL